MAPDALRRGVAGRWDNRADGPGRRQERDGVFGLRGASVGARVAARRGGAEALADGELFALAIGRDVWRGCQPDSKTSWGGEFRIVVSVGIGLAQATSRQREYEDQALSGDFGCRLFGGNPQTGVVI